MKVDKKSPYITPIAIGFCLLSIGTAQITALRALTKLIQSTFITPSSVKEVQPAKFSPQIYYLDIVNSRIQLTPKTVRTAATSPELALSEALEELLTKPIAFDPTSTIPPQTRLLDFHVSEDGIHVDLSQEFARGGGSSSMIYRVAQVLYTVTSLDSKTPVFLSIEGKPLGDRYPLGGEGLTLDYPTTRQQFNRDFLTK